ncbi:MAG: hypothetical protein CML47_01445 [Rhodobacteraceae bacterium]|nr:MAG: hypothetical protein CML47_01445 [Paracoccaceae bacterium]|tara:strand:+ start:1965 stop:3389 length:1425 start_codon:yes stop_codon:yes gene_type:complete
MIERIEKALQPYIVSFRLDGLQYIGAIFAPLYFNYWKDIDNNDHLYVLLCSIGFIYGMISNNYYDYETDLKYNPEKVMLSKFSLKIWSKVFTLLYFVLHTYLSTRTTSIYYKYGSVLAFFLVSAYTKYLKRMVFIKNISTAIYMCYLPIFIFVASHDEQKMAYFTAIPFTCLIVIREVMLDIYDINADKGAGIKTLPTLFGVSNTQNILKFIVISLWILGIYIHCTPVPNTYPCQVGLISNMASYSLFRIHSIIGDNDRKYMTSALLFYYFWNILLYQHASVTLSVAGASIIYLIIKSDIGLHWKENNVFNRKLVHMGIGCLLVSLSPKDASAIVLFSLLAIIFILPSLRLGIEKYNEPLSYDTGVLCWLFFSFLWCVMHNSATIDSYHNCLPFYIADPAGAIVGRTTNPKLVKLIWKNKSLQGSAMIWIVSYVLSKSILLPFLITSAELFGDDYDNGIIGTLLIGAATKYKVV